MEPFLRPGEVVLVWQWGKPKIGDVVVFRRGEEFWVKRIVAVSSESSAIRFLVEGDNKGDSLGVQPLKREQILGRVVRLGYGRGKRA